MKHITASFNTTPERLMESLNPNLVTENKGILYFNTGIYATGNEIDNAMPIFINQLRQASSIHSNLLQLKYTQVLGQNLDIWDTTDSKAIELAEFIKKRNKSNDNLKSVYAKCAKDFSIFEAATIQILYDYEGKVAEIYHVPVENVRMAKPDNYNRINSYYISTQWGDISNSRYKKKNAQNSAVKVSAFNPTSWRESPVQLLYISAYSPQTFYACPGYLSATNWILIDNLISSHEISNLNSNYFLSGMLTQQGNPTTEEMQDFIKDFQELYKGVGTNKNQKEKMMFSWVDDMASQKSEFQSFQSTMPNFTEILDKAENKIIYAHNAYSDIAGKNEKSASLGGDGNALYVGLQAYTQLVCNQMKDTLVDGFNQVLEVNGYNNLLSVTTDEIRTTQPKSLIEDLSLEERRMKIFGLDTNVDINSTAGNIIDKTSNS